MSKSLAAQPGMTPGKYFESKGRGQRPDHFEENKAEKKAARDEDKEDRAKRRVNDRLDRWESEKRRNFEDVTEADRAIKRRQFEQEEGLGDSTGATQSEKIPPGLTPTNQYTKDGRRVYIDRATGQKVARRQ